MGETRSPRVIQVGVDRTTAALDRLAQLHAARTDEGPASLPSGAAMVALATCHRLELYLEGIDASHACAAFRGWVGNHPAGDPLTVREGSGAARHLFRVAAGLESAVLGEDEILRQLRDAYRVACGRGSAGPLLHRVFHTAFRVGRRVRGETRLGAGTRSLAGAAVAALDRRIGHVHGRTVLVLGAGEMAHASARLLAERGVGRLLVANRTPARATALALAIAGESAP